MSLNVCADCTTKFSIGAEQCPHCGGAAYYEEGSMLDAAQPEVDDAAEKPKRARKATDEAAQ